MSKEKTTEKQNKNFLSGLFRQQIFIPIAALIILAVFNLIADPSFFKITLGYNSAGDPVLHGGEGGEEQDPFGDQFEAEASRKFSRTRRITSAAFAT